jgi:hypothetical protein
MNMFQTRASCTVAEVYDSWKRWEGITRSYCQDLGSCGKRQVRENLRVMEENKQPKGLEA